MGEKNELQELVEQYLGTRVLTDRNAVIEKAFRLICFRVRTKYINSGLDVDDVIQNSVVMLITRLGKYDSSRAVFTSFVCNTVDNVVKAMLKKAYSSVDVQERTSIHVDNEDYDISALERGEEDLDTLYESVAEHGDFRDDVAMEDKLDRFLETITEDERYVLVNRLALKKHPKQSMVEIAKHFGHEEYKDYHSFLYHQDKTLDWLRNYWLYNGQEMEGVPMEFLAAYASRTNSRRRKYILEHKFGLHGVKKMSVEEIANNLNLDTEQVKMTIRQSFERLNRYMNNMAAINANGWEVVEDEMENK